MAITDQLRDKKKGKSRGAVNVGGALAGLGQAGTRGNAAADWRTVDFTWLAGVVIETTSRGGMVSFGLSRDRGAYSINIFLEGDSRKIWVSSEEDINAKLEEITHFMASLPD